jgi:serine/threonine-protein kinase
VIQEVHQASGDGQWRPSASGWSFHRLLQAFHRACEAVGFAHARGVIHRDLKPENIMLGSYGEVLVLDWGLAKVVGEHEVEAPELDAVQTDRSLGGATSTKMGTVAGTPAYMPPEQARGDLATFTADVYALGAVLYDILSGAPPYVGPTAEHVLRLVRTGPPRRLQRPNRTWTPGPRLDLDAPPPPEALVDICERAMMREPADRFASAGELANAVLGFLEGARVREQALTLVAEADNQVPRLAAIAERAKELRSRASVLVAALPRNAPTEQKRPAWALEDDAREIELQGAVEEVKQVQLLRGALSLDPTLVEAHERLAQHYRGRMAMAEAAGDLRAVRQYEWYLRSHDDGQNAAWLRGDGELTLVTDPPGARVELSRYVERDRRFVLEQVRAAGRTPLRSWRLPMGSYVVTLSKDGFAPVQYPVQVERQGHWDGVPPGASDTAPIRMLPSGMLDADDCYVPGGWYISGGADTPGSGNLPRRRVWVDAFVIRRFPATNKQWIAFLDDLVRRGLEAEALAFAPRERSGTPGDAGSPVYGRHPDGTFFLREDAEGDLWQPEWPVMLINWNSARAYAQWEAERTGLPWRLPGEFEWEKAARGVDGRTLPWGNHLDPTFTNMRDSRSDRPMPAAVDSFPVDESPYGVRGMAGNVRDFCIDVYQADGPQLVDGRAQPPALEEGSKRTLRGGAFPAYERSAGIAFRLGDSGEGRIPYAGARLCRSV